MEQNSEFRRQIILNCFSVFFIMIILLIAVILEESQQNYVKMKTESKSSNEWLHGR
jgi:hypothetical protein